MDLLLKKFIYYLESQENPTFKSIIRDLDLKEYELSKLINLLNEQGLRYEYMNLYMSNKEDLIKTLKKGGLHEKSFHK